MSLGKFFMFLGGLIFVIGLFLSYSSGLSLLSWFGKLPGDIHIKNEQSVIFIPFTSMIVVSLIITLGLNFIAWLMKP